VAVEVGEGERVTIEEKAEQIRNRYRRAGLQPFWSHAADAAYQVAQDRNHTERVSEEGREEK
jgi:hypothetical protein